ncbi:Putative eukaryotic translation initiation factor 3 subunit D [Septoria linicola]|uniref:Eukaryotic translation initiation factor 3 subunit D n=1 Tax=Septoria linicola TaxID=215465 RepID=A0A9Q9EEQ3_9PEZI|nr:putative eukaryotic translation initiation factor 3 subunit D [Septoria linicola]USW48120.1 Putative eukaryotic translation initiation factor 3 subunit D [Septoria linicola]
MPGRLPPGLLEAIEALPASDTWGPPTTTETTLNGIPYAPFSKGDKLGRMADWTSEGKEREGRGGRAQYNNRYRDQVYGATGLQTAFQIEGTNEESSFSLVDRSQPSTRGRGFGRGSAVFGRGRGGRGGAQGQRGGRGTFQRVGGRGAQQQYDSRGGRGGRGGRRGGWKDWDKPQRNREASVQPKDSWKMLDEIDFNRLQKLNLDTGEGEDLDDYGFLYYYDRSYDKQPGAPTSIRKLTVLDRAAYNVTTSSDPVIQELAEKDEAQIFAADNILSMLMCAPRSVYSWDIIMLKQGNKIYIDKREGSSLDMVTVNENAADAPLELSEGNKDQINAPGALKEEATHINNIFPLQVVQESETSKRDMNHEHPFYDPSSETDPPASKAYKYRRFDLSLEADAEPLHLIVRSELDAVVKNNISGEDQYLTIKALNEFDNKAQGSGGALDWRSKLASQRGAVVATEMKNNSCKLARWTTQSILAKADLMKLGFVSRANPKSTTEHVVLGVLGYKPREFASQMNLNLNNGWAIVRTFVDMVMKEDDGKYVLVKDPNKPTIRLYNVPPNTFEEDDVEAQSTIPEGDDE